MPEFRLNEPTDYFRLLEWLHEPKPWPVVAWQWGFIEALHPHDGVPGSEKALGRWSQVNAYKSHTVRHDQEYYTADYALWDWEWRLRKKIGSHSLHILRSLVTRFQRTLGDEIALIRTRCPVPMWRWSVERVRDPYNPLDTVMTLRGRGYIQREHLLLMQSLTRQLCNQVKSVFAFRSGFKTVFEYGNPGRRVRRARRPIRSQ